MYRLGDGGERARRGGDVGLPDGDVDLGGGDVPTRLTEVTVEPPVADQSCSTADGDIAPGGNCVVGGPTLWLFW